MPKYRDYEGIYRVVFFPDDMVGLHRSCAALLTVCAVEFGNSLLNGLGEGGRSR